MVKRIMIVASMIALTFVLAIVTVIQKVLVEIIGRVSQYV